MNMLVVVSFIPNNTGRAFMVALQKFPKIQIVANG
jgi:hypothetical protein